jgi:hypothetical protein
MKPKASTGAHRWAFARTGGVDQVLLRDGKDIEAIPDLDQKLWAALAMPKKAAGVLPETLDAMDTSGDGRIRALEVVEAVRFCSANLKDLGVLLEPGESIRTADLVPGPVAEAAAWVLETAGKRGAPEIALEEARGGLARFASNRLNGDGVVPPASAEDEGVKALAADIVAAGYGVPDLSGAAGVSKARLDAFLADAKAWLAWSRAPQSDSALRPLGEATGPAWTATEGVRTKLDDYFLRAGLAAISGAKGTAAWGQEARLAALLASGISMDSPDLRELPLAAPAGNGELDLAGALNPAWSASVRAFASFVAPILGKETGALDAAGWARVKAKLAPYGAWLAARPAGNAGSLGDAKLLAVLEGTSCAALDALIAEDAKWSARKQYLGDLVKLLLLRRDLLRILRNFVNFSDFYGKCDAVFQAGKLYVDGRQCDLCLEVDNPAAHSALAVMSGVYLIYCDCSRKGGGQKSVVAALTAGEAGNLFVGKNAVFYDRLGNDWDARITKIQVQPISIREAFFSPYRWLSRTIEDLVAKRAATAEAGRQEKLKGQAQTAVEAVAAPTSAKPPALDLPKKVDVGTVAAIGVALGSIGAMVTGILSAFVGMGAWMPVGLVAIFVLISGPSMILAYLKLRRRNLGPVLDAEGWAINGRLKINVPFGNALTRLAVLPAGSERLFQDPFAEKKKPWGLYLLLLVVVALAVLWAVGVLDPLLPEGARLKSLLGIA